MKKEDEGKGERRKERKKEREKGKEEGGEREREELPLIQFPLRKRDSENHNTGSRIAILLCCVNMNWRRNVQFLNPPEVSSPIGLGQR